MSCSQPANDNYCLKQSYWKTCYCGVFTWIGMCQVAADYALISASQERRVRREKASKRSTTRTQTIVANMLVFTTVSRKKHEDY